MSLPDRTQPEAAAAPAPMPVPETPVEITPVEFIVRRLSTEFKLDEPVVAAILDLIDAGASVPFIGRYRRDESAGLDERRLYEFRHRLAELRALERRAQQVAVNIEQRGELTPKLHKRLTTSLDPLEVEDLYLRYRDNPKSPTHADEEAGLEPLAETVLRSRGPAEKTLGELAAEYLKPEAGYDDVAKVLRGAYRLMGRRMIEDAEIRRLCRRQLWKSARIITRPGKNPAGEFKEYHDFSQQVSRILPYRVLTIDRGESRLALQVELQIDEAPLMEILVRRFVRNDSTFRQEIVDAAHYGLHHYLVPALNVQVRNRLSQRACEHAVGVLGRNLRTLLMTRPVTGRPVLAMHPAGRGGTPVAALDPDGQVLETATIDLGDEAAAATIVDLATRHGLKLFVVGGESAGQDALKLISKLIAEQLPEVEFLTVPETGAAAYACSKLAVRELPDLDVPHRVAVTLGRRVLHPLAEYLKAPPRTLAMGLHQHDVDSQRLDRALDEVAESCVADIGLDINRAGDYLLAYLPGLTREAARAVAAFRDGGGTVAGRDDLHKVPGLDELAWQQVAGFVVIHDGPEPLDATWVHPECYGAARQLLADLGLSPTDVLDRERLSEVRSRLRQVTATPEMAERFGMTPLNFDEMMRHLCHPGEDPRKSRPRPLLHKQLVPLVALEPGRQLRGTVRNVVDFGAFVDVGAEHDGLVHVTQMSDQFVRQPHDFLSIGDIVTVWVTSVDTQRNRLSLSMLRPDRKESGPRRSRSRRGRGGPPKDASREDKPRRRRGGGEESRSERPDRPPREKSRPSKPRPPRQRPDGNFRKLLEQAGIVDEKKKE